MTAEMGGFRTDLLVEQLAEQVRATTDRMEAEAKLAVVLANDDRANISYNKCLLGLSDLTGVFVDDFHYPSEQAAADGIPELNTLFHAVIGLLPSGTKEGEDKIVAAIDPFKDPDALRGGFPATSEAELLIAEHIAGVPIKYAGRVGMVGYGWRTNRPLEPKLIDKGNKPAVILKTQEEILAGLEAGALQDIDVVFAAAKAGHIIKPHHLKPGAIVIDAGYGLIHKDLDPSVEANYGQNVSPEVFEMKNVIATCFRAGVGRVSGLVIHKRTVGIASKLLVASFS